MNEPRADRPRPGKPGGVRVLHAEPPALDPALGGDAALRRIGLAGLDHLSRNEAAALAGMPGGIHQMRVAARRLRAMMSGFAERLPAHQRHWATEELCWLADALATVRNLDVFETALLSPAQRASDDPLAFEPLRRAAERQRRAARPLGDRGDPIGPLRRLIAQSPRLVRQLRVAELDRRHAGPPVGGVAEDVLRRRWRAAKKRGKRSTTNAEQRHRLRIALKKLRYTTEVARRSVSAGAVAPTHRRG